MPHPLFHLVEVKVQTNGNIKPIDSIKSSIESLAKDFEFLEKQLERKLAEHKMWYQLL